MPQKFAQILALSCAPIHLRNELRISGFFPRMSVVGCIIVLSNERLTMTELETEIYALMAECEAEGVNGNSTDENADPRLERIGNLLSLLQVVDWEGYKRLVLAKFNVPKDYFD